MRPRYAPRACFRTRLSALEVRASDDLTATALDRPVLAIEALRARARSERARPVERVHRVALPAPLRWLPVVLAGAVGAGLGFGGTLAWLT